MFDSELYDIAIYPMQFFHKENEILKNSISPNNKQTCQ